MSGVSFDLIDRKHGLRIAITTVFVALVLLTAGLLGGSPVSPNATDSDVDVLEETPDTAASQPVAPIRAAFFYPWFPEAWDQGGTEPFTNYSPSLGFYDSEDPTTISQQLSMARDAGIDAFISSWWGPGHHTDTALGTLLDETVAQGSTHPDLRWSIYYEEEGQTDPTPADILGDLIYLEKNYFSRPGYLRVDGKPVVFVWADAADGQDMVDRWDIANRAFGNKAFVVLKVFSGFRDADPQPESWHQYGPASAYSEHLPYSATVSPGFWLKGESVRLQRDTSRFSADVERMVQSGAFWQLITTWNEWGEGTSVEPAAEFGSDYLDVLGGNATESRTVSFTAGGDIGAGGDTDETLAKLADQKGSFFLALGDLSYSDVTPEASWCDYMQGYLGADFPVQVLVGNHEDDDRVDGFIGDFAACLPDRMNSTGVYGAEYFFDVEGLARIIMIGAGNDVDGIKYDYEVGTERYEWLNDTIDAARSQGIPWVIVGMHKVCLTAGNKPCEVGQEVIDLLMEKRVDLVLSGHDHDYQRSHQLSCATVDVFEPQCISDSGDDDSYEAGKGTVFVVAGLTGGGGMTPIDANDPEYEYFAETLGAGDSDEGRGFLKVTLNQAQMSVSFVGTTTAFEDSFQVVQSGSVFVDDDGNVHETNIEAIARAGITVGCNPPTNSRYCPSSAVTRSQMAAFLRRALRLPSSQADFFEDDDTSIFEDDINALAAAGITQGCNPPKNDAFCGNRSITREEMAAFLRRAFDYPSTSTDFFSDDATSIFQDDINAIALIGVTRGCNPPVNDEYCPKRIVRRDQMASFLSRALGLR